MSFVTLNEFQRLANLSDASLMWLLKNNQLDCKMDPDRGILIDISSSDTEKLVEAIAKQKNKIISERENLLAQKQCRIIIEEVDKIVDEAIQRALARVS